jgi:citrate synthase
VTGSYAWHQETLAWPVTTEVGPGLRGVIAGETAVSWLDPSSGVLMYRGVPVERLAGALSFEEVAFLLITGARHDEAPEAFRAFAAALRASRTLPAEVVSLVRSMPRDAHPTLLLRAGVSALGCFELRVGDDLAGERHWREMRIVAQVAALVAEIARHRRGLASHACDAQCSMAQGMLKAICTERAADRADEQALDLLWVLYADHGLDAPSFTSLIVASCHADPYYNVVAGLSALRGPLLGGAAERVLEQLLPLADEDAARAWVCEAAGRGERIAGFGHRSYRMPDPRAAVLRKEAALLARRRGQDHRFAIWRAVEAQATMLLAPRGAHVNVNFYAALLFHLLGAEAPLLSCLYGVGRMAGLVARVREALETGRLYRPLVRYEGPEPRGIDAGRGEP